MLSKMDQPDQTVWIFAMVFPPDSQAVRVSLKMTFIYQRDARSLSS